MHHQQVGERRSCKVGHRDGRTQLVLLYKPDVEPLMQICPLKSSNHKDVARTQNPHGPQATAYSPRGHMHGPIMRYAGTK